MREASGIISREELETYGGAEIAMLDAKNDSTNSGGGFAEGTGSFYYSVRWDDNGFTGVNWLARGMDYEEKFPDPAMRDEKIRQQVFNLALYFNDHAEYDGCYEFYPV